MKKGYSAWTVVLCAWVAAIAIDCGVLEPTVRAEMAVHGDSRTAPNGRSDSAAFRPRRLIHRFDFEERQQGNYEDLPRHWHAIGRTAQTGDEDFLHYPLHQEMVKASGYPTHEKIQFDATRRRSGQTSFYLGLDGGNAGAFIEVGTVPAVPGSDYQIGGTICTSKLRYAKACLVAYFIDAQGRVIESSRVSSPMIQSEDRWTAVKVLLKGQHDDAAWIGMQVMVAQPEPSGELGKHELLYRDIQGGAWFDDIEVWQALVVSVGTQSPVNIIRGGQRPVVTIHVRDRTGLPLVAEVKAYDHQMRLAGSQRKYFRDTSEMKWDWEPKLRLFGWYMIELVLYDAGAAEKPGDTGEKINAPSATIAQVNNAFLWSPDDAMSTAEGRSRFALDAQDLPEELMGFVPTIAEKARLGWVFLSCWDQSTTKATVEQRRAKLDRVIERLATDNRRITLSLSPLPDELAATQEMGIKGALPLLIEPPDVWFPFLASTMMLHGQRVHSWLVGSTKEPDLFFMEGLPGMLASVTREFQGMAPNPTLVLPWRLDQSRRGDIREQIIYAISVPTSVRPPYIPSHTTEWTQNGSSPYVLALQPLDAREVSHARRVDDMALRMIYGWASGAAGLSISKPWWVAKEPSLSILPDPVLGVFSGVAARLAGRRVVGRLNLGSGIESLIFDGPAGGMMAVWSVSTSKSQSVADLYLGAVPQTVDVWENRVAVPLVGREHRLVVTQSPLFVEGVDPTLALFRGAFEVTPQFIESTQAPIQCVLTLANPWQRTLTGTMTVIEPADWRFEPAQSQFSIAPGQKTKFPLTLQLPVSEVAGNKTLRVRVDMTADEHYVIDLKSELELGLKGVVFDGSLDLETDPQTGRVDAVVTQTVTNSGRKPMSLYAFSTLKGYPRQEWLITKLDPGQSVIRRVRFPNAGEVLKQSDIRIGLREASGPAVINRILKTKDEPHEKPR